MSATRYRTVRTIALETHICTPFHHYEQQQVHERTVDSDFLIIILRDLALQRKDLTLVLMSATLNADVSQTRLCRRWQALMLDYG